MFTASHQAYADAILDYIDPNNEYIQARLYRQHCFLTSEGYYVKDLRIFGDRDLKDVVIVDNDLIPRFRSMTLMRFPTTLGEWRTQNEEAIHRRADHQGGQGVRGRRQSRRYLSLAQHLDRHLSQLEGQIRWTRSQRGQAA